jgi:hypothetical protein
VLPGCGYTTYIPTHTGTTEHLAPVFSGTTERENFMNTTTKRRRTRVEFKKRPMCELLHNKPAKFFTYRGDFVPVYAKKDEPTDDDSWLKPMKISELPDREPVGNWVFVSLDAPENVGSDYTFEIDDFFKSPSSTVDWLAHLHEKAWFDANDFCAMLSRFREATGSYGCL